MGPQVRQMPAKALALEDLNSVIFIFSYMRPQNLPPVLRRLQTTVDPNGEDWVAKERPHGKTIHE